MPRTTGTHQQTSHGGETVRAFVPYPLPPGDPSLVLDAGDAHGVPYAAQVPHARFGTACHSWRMLRISKVQS